MNYHDVRDWLRTKSGRQAATLAVLVTAIGLVVLIRNAGQGPASVSADEHNPTSIADAPGVHDEWVPPRAIAWPSTVRRDPFARETTSPVIRTSAIEQEARQLLRLSGIMRSESSHAIINGVMRQEGDLVSGFRIHQITQHCVIVEKNGQLVELAM